MGIVIFVMGAVVAVLLSMLVGGLLVPPRFSASRVLQLRASPESVWSLVADPAGYSVWRDAVTSVDIDGRAPLRWREFGDDGASAFEASAVNAPHQFAAHSLDDGDTRRTARVFLLTPHDDGTRIELTEHLVISNPLARFLRQYVIRRSRSLDVLARELAHSLGESAVTPQ